MLAACAHRAPTPVLAPLEASGPGVTVTLRWTASVDLDLYVTDPDLETAYFANPRTRSGGVLARDARCADGPPGARTEQVHWTTPPPGRYRVGVDFPEVCGSGPAQVGYLVTIDVEGRRQERDGRARLLEREPQVLEFEVP